MVSPIVSIVALNETYNSSLVSPLHASSFTVSTMSLESMAILYYYELPPNVLSVVSFNEDEELVVPVLSSDRFVPFERALPIETPTHMAPAITTTKMIAVSRRN